MENVPRCYSCLIYYNIKENINKFLLYLYCYCYYCHVKRCVKKVALVHWEWDKIIIMKKTTTTTTTMLNNKKWDERGNIKKKEENKKRTNNVHMFVWTRYLFWHFITSYSTFILFFIIFIISRIKHVLLFFFFSRFVALFYDLNSSVCSTIHSWL